MQIANKISAFFFLGLFSLMILHQSFPHLHHQHEDTHSHSHSDVAHSGEHHHNDDSSNENEESPDNFFRLFMDMHVHSNVSSDMVVLKRTTVEQRTIADKDVANTSFDTQRLFLIDSGQNESPPIYHPPNTYFNPYLSCLDLRGPPTLG
jgi:hypothetical protein